MSQRHSTYARQANDLYVTPQWVWAALYSVEAWAREAWDCCPVNADFDFLEMSVTFKDLASNPPYGQSAERVIRHAIDLTSRMRKPGRVAMLLPHAYDCAKGRVDLFKNLPFKCKYTLTERIRWDNLDQKKAGPSTNHAWYVWDWKHIGPARMGWL